eukprot:159990-Pelagomonas_calceolata.AAC.1
MPAEIARADHKNWLKRPWLFGNCFGQKMVVSTTVVSIGIQGIGLQPENLADRLLVNILIQHQ